METGSEWYFPSLKAWNEAPSPTLRIHSGRLASRETVAWRSTGGARGDEVAAWRCEAMAWRRASPTATLPAIFSLLRWGACVFASLVSRCSAPCARFDVSSWHRRVEWRTATTRSGGEPEESRVIPRALMPLEILHCTKLELERVGNILAGYMVKNLFEGLESCSANYCNVKFLTIMMLVKLFKIFSYLCLALFGTMDGNMVLLNGLESWN
ncbi:uncharacterized protein LOC120688620 [Panicum virgatum]|uniref:uncharacterized protein LOC120688620 n=1 Tax=Panicum virgatum TaxID=38727 RepID=UPI0019D57840|nr:uncharacterized protein LOC120688620 [Panicum virgatum]